MPGWWVVVNEVTSGDWVTIHLHSARATFRDLLEPRIIMEPVVARLAASRLTPQGKAEIPRRAQQGDTTRTERLMLRHLTEVVAAIDSRMPDQMDELIDWR